MRDTGNWPIIVKRAKETIDTQDYWPGREDLAIGFAVFQIRTERNSSIARFTSAGRSAKGK
jgi:hypothetical protein